MFSSKAGGQGILPIALTMGLTTAFTIRSVDRPVDSTLRSVDSLHIRSVRLCNLVVAISYGNMVT